MATGAMEARNLAAAMTGAVSLGGSRWVAGIIDQSLVLWESTGGDLLERQSAAIWDTDSIQRVALAAHDDQLVCVAGDSDDVHYALIRLEGENRPRVGEWRPLPWSASAFACLSIGGSAHLFTLAQPVTPQTISIMHSILSPNTVGWRRLASLQTTVPRGLRLSGGEGANLDCVTAFDLDAQLSGTDVILDAALSFDSDHVHYHAVRRPRGWPRGDWVPGRWSVEATGAAGETPAQGAGGEQVADDELAPKELLGELEQLVNDYESLKEMVDALRQENIRLEAQNDRLNRELHSVHRRIAEMRSGNTRTRDELRHAIDDREELARRLSGAEEKLNDLARKMAPRNADEPVKNERNMQPGAFANLLDRFVRWVRE